MALPPILTLIRFDRPIDYDSKALRCKNGLDTDSSNRCQLILKDLR